MKDTQCEYYLSILELAPGASVQEVKTAYRELCLIWHPDKNPERVSARATKKLQALNEAYQWLLQHGNLRDDAPPKDFSVQHFSNSPAAPCNRPHAWWRDIGTAWQKVLQRAFKLIHTPTAHDLERLSTRLLAIEKLDVSNTTITDLTPLHALRNLRKLECDNTPITDLSPLRELMELRELDCWNTAVASLEPLAQLPHLQRLNCNNTPIDSLEPLRNLENLKQLSCSGTRVRSLEPVRGLANLENLSCGETRIESLEPVQRLTQLRVLYCSQTPITSLAPLHGLPNLQKLYCLDTQVPLHEIGRFRTAFPHCTVSY